MSMDSATLTYSRDDHIALPMLKNFDLADSTFFPLGLCLTMPSSAELFFSGSRKKQALAKEICDECLVSPECHQYALITEQGFGMWGGVGEVERNAIIQTNRRNNHDQ